MKRLFLIALIFLFNTAFALDVVYPKQNRCEINAKSVFFLGNVHFGKELTINSKPVKIWYGNIFVETLPLQEGENTFVFKSDGITRKYVITKHTRKKSSKIFKNTDYHTFLDNAILHTTTKDKRTPVREKPVAGANRVCDLPKDTTLYFTGQKSGFFKLYTSDKKELWVDESSLDKRHFSFLSKITMSNIFADRIYSDNGYNNIELYLSMPVLYTTELNGTNIKLTLYGVNSNKKLEQDVFKQNAFDNLTVKQESNNLVFYINSDKDNWGYLAEYKNGKFFFRLKKAPKPDKHLPLANVNIFIDAGHGGSQFGAVGPTRVNEKDINLKIALKLASELKQRGANVSLSRTNDVDLGLYERVDMANANKAHIFISIHANALPDGQNPIERHGTSVYYYNENARELAQIIGKNLVSDTGLKDDGVRTGNFAVLRSTMPLSVMVETAYMTYPPEYILLQDTSFQRILVRSIADSIEAYTVSKSAKN